MTAFLPYGPPIIKTINIIGLFFGLFCKKCDVSCAIYMLVHVASLFLNSGVF